MAVHVATPLPVSAEVRDSLRTEYIEFSVCDDMRTSDTSDSDTFAPQSERWVTKNILVWATDSTDQEGPDGFTQCFSQGLIPEPSTWLLMGLGLAGLWGAGRKMAVRA